MKLKLYDLKELDTKRTEIVEKTVPGRVIYATETGRLCRTILHKDLPVSSDKCFHLVMECKGLLLLQIKLIFEGQCMHLIKWGS